jgi:glyoxylase-like metal-dependent hydrolase (beta-lactamase superfamily II)
MQQQPPHSDHELVTTIDLHFKGLREHVAAFLVRSPEGPVLVECGPALCLPALEKGLGALGLSLSDIKRLFLTHIHLDHAGATGSCTRAGATAYVHPRGAPHLVDPSRLMGSASRVFGEELDQHLGWLEPSPENQIVAVEDGQTIQIGEMSFTAIETLGHASHHHAWLMTYEGERHVFSGDTAGMRLPGTSFVTLPLVAPELDPVKWQESIKRVGDLQADRLWLTHFGSVDDQEAFLRDASALLHTECALLRSLLEGTPDPNPEDVIARYRSWHLDLAKQHQIDPDLLNRYCSDIHYESNIAGATRWLLRSGS